MKQIIFFLLVLMSSNVSSQLNSFPIDMKNDSNYSKVLKIIIDKQLVGIGECSHGIKEFSEFTASTVRFLMENGEYKAIFIENGFYATYKVNKFVQGSMSILNLDSLVKYNFSPVFNTNFLKSLLIWMRQYNSKMNDPNKKLSIWGIDMNGNNGFSELVAYLQQNKGFTEIITPDVFELFNKMNDWQNFKYRGLTRDQKSLLKYTISLLNKGMNELKIKQAGKNSIEEYNLQILNLKIINQLYENSKINVLKWLTYRNKKMAENLFWITNNILSSKKSILYAHNNHLDGSLKKNTGGFIKNKLVGYYPIAQDFIEGDIRNVYSGEVKNYPVDPKSFASRFIADSGNTFFVNFEQDFNIKIKENRSGLLHSFSPNFTFKSFKPRKSFSAIVIHRYVQSL